MDRCRKGMWGVGCALGLAVATGAVGEDPLPRRAFLGAQLTPGLGGVRMPAILPGGTLEKAGVQPGDVIAKINGVVMTSPGDVINVMRTRREGDALDLTIVRDGEEFEQPITLVGRPRETDESIEIIYDHVSIDGERYRTIITRPLDADGPRPAMLAIQGIGCTSEEFTPGGLELHKDLLYGLTREDGFITMRVDKPGVGDSEGGPCPEVDFKGELAAFRAALEDLKLREDVDPNRIYIFGHSMGGVMAPILAAENPVNGIVVYGTVVRTWYEYELENARRQMRMDGTDPREIEAFIRNHERFGHYFFHEHLSPDEIIVAAPDLEEHLRAIMPEVPLFHAGKTYTFFQQVYDVPLATLWSSVDAHVLAVNGSADFVVSRLDHEMIAETVNRTHPGKGEHVEMPGLDHLLRDMGTPEESMANFMTAPMVADPALTELVRDWLQRIEAAS